jgi:hypothetical protein
MPSPIPKILNLNLRVNALASVCLSVCVCVCVCAHTRVCVVPSMEPRASQMLSKHSSTELYLSFDLFKNWPNDSNHAARVQTSALEHLNSARLNSEQTSWKNDLGLLSQKNLVELDTPLHSNFGLVFMPDR